MAQPLHRPILTITVESEIGSFWGTASDLETTVFGAEAAELITPPKRPLGIDDLLKADGLLTARLPSARIAPDFG